MSRTIYHPLTGTFILTIWLTGLAFLWTPITLLGYFAFLFLVALPAIPSVYVIALNSIHKVPPSGGGTPTGFANGIFTFCFPPCAIILAVIVGAMVAAYGAPTVASAKHVCIVSGALIIVFALRGTILLSRQ